MASGTGSGLPPATGSSAPAGSPAASCAAKSAVTTGLGKDVDAEVAKSPKFTKLINDLQSKGWSIEYGEKGKGTYCDKNKKKIVVDSSKKGDTKKVLSSLAHEGGHAAYKEDPYVSPKGLKKEEYVKANLKRHLKDEGEATLTAIEIKKDLKEHGGPEIAVLGAKADEYEKIAAKYPDAKDRDKAREEIGEAFAKGEHPEIAPDKTYEEYYSGPYAEHYDKLPESEKTK